MKTSNWIIPVILLLAFAFQPANAQDGKLRKANKLFEKFSYPEAAEAYKKILAKEDSPDAKIKLAECYRMMNRPLDAEYWYSQVVDLGESDDINKLHYGYALKANGKFEEARQMFLEYSHLVPADTRGLRQEEACSMAEFFLTDPSIYTITNLSINSAESDFGPAIFKDKGLVFASARGMQFKDKMYNWTGKPFLDLYLSDREGDSGPTALGAPRFFKGELNTWMHEGTVTFNNDFSTMYFTRDNYYKGRKGKDEEGVIKLKVFEAKWKGDKWSDIKELPFNNDQFSCGHPALSNDGQALYFVSDMPGGYGETDIYVSYKTGDSWGSPENLGPEINTEGREMFPFLSADGVLYFASDALPGLGGLDIFSSKNMEGVWTPPENLRYPINTNADDFGYIIDAENEEGYFASNRAGGKGDDDIYAFNKATFMINGVVVQCETQDPIESAVVQLLENEVVMQEFTTYADGAFTFPIEAGKTYTVIASKANFSEGNQKVNTVGLSGEGVDVKVPVCPAKDFLSDKCVVSGVVTDKEGAEPIEGLTVRLVNAETDFEKSTTTEVDGSYFFEVDPETDYVIFVSGEYVLTASKNISTKGIDCSSELLKDIPMDFDLRTIPKELGDGTGTGTGTDDPWNTGSGDRTGLGDGSGGEFGDGTGSGTGDGTGTGDGSGSGWDTIGGGTGDGTGSGSGSGTGIPGVDITEDLLTDYGIDLNHIYYDFDKAEIRTDAKGELDKVVQFLYQNPGITVELGSHTDSRGEHAYNFDLSQRRAQAAVDYLISKGIKSDKMVPTGYGETQLVNECSDGVSCSSSKHQENRRTEFKVIGYNSKVIYSVPRYFGKGNLLTGGSSTYSSSSAGTTSSYDSSYTTGTTTSTTSSGSTSNTTYFDNIDGSASTAGSSTGTISYDTGSTQYKIQLGAFRTPDMSRFDSLSDLGMIDSESTTSGITRIVLGPFSDRGTAESIKNQVTERGFYDSFIVTYQNGLRAGK